MKEELKNKIAVGIILFCFFVLGIFIVEILIGAFVVRKGGCTDLGFPPILSAQICKK
jgi:hypothetical protein